jgi:hypothetical protein
VQARRIHFGQRHFIDGARIVAQPRDRMGSCVKAEPERTAPRPFARAGGEQCCNLGQFINLGLDWVHQFVAIAPDQAGIDIA